MQITKTKVTETEITEIDTEEMPAEEISDVLYGVDTVSADDEEYEEYEEYTDCGYDSIEYALTPLQQGYRAWGARRKNEALYGIDPTVEVNLVEDLVFSCLQDDFKSRE